MVEMLKLGAPRLESESIEENLSDPGILIVAMSHMIVRYVSSIHATENIGIVLRVRIPSYWLWPGI